MPDLEKDLQVVNWKQYDRTPQANTNTNGWVDISDIRYTEPKYEVVSTMGFKVKEDANWITLAQSIKDGMASIITTILKRDIISQTSLYKTPQVASKPLDRTAYTNVIQNKIQKASGLTTSPISRTFTPQQITTVVKPETKNYNLHLDGVLGDVDIEKFIQCVDVMSYKQLSKKFGISATYVSKLKGILRDKNLLSEYTGPARQVGETNLFNKYNIDRNEFIEAYNTGMTHLQLAEFFNTEHHVINSITRYLQNKNVIDRRKRRMRRVTYSKRKGLLG